MRDPELANIQARGVPNLGWRRGPGYCTVLMRVPSRTRVAANGAVDALPILGEILSETIAVGLAHNWVTALAGSGG
jgi:hypothetical protein